MVIRQNIEICIAVYRAALHFLPFRLHHQQDAGFSCRCSVATWFVVWHLSSVGAGVRCLKIADLGRSEWGLEVRN